MTPSQRILIVEDDRSERNALIRLLRLEGFDPIGAANGQMALAQLDESIDLVISDLKMPGMDGLELLRHWRERDLSTPFVMATAYGDVATAVQAMKLGAADYLTKPVHPEELLLMVERILANRDRDAALVNLTERLDRRLGFANIVGASAAMEDAIEKAKRAAHSDCIVLILGESGVGKELFAEAIHQHSDRSAGPLVVANMAAIPNELVESELFGHCKGAFTGAVADRKGRFELAHRGTLFIDEIGDFALSCQAKLLRVLETLRVTPIGSNEEREVDPRVVAATSRNLNKMMAAGQFREDLFYRLNVVTIMIPPLRTRRDDIPKLIDHFLGLSCEKNRRERPKLETELYQFLQEHDWPGNVRQLRNCIESMIVMASGPSLRMSDLPLFVRQKPEAGVIAGADGSLAFLERSVVMETLERFGGNRTRAAASLGISVRTLQRWLRSWKSADPDPMVDHG